MIFIKDEEYEKYKYTKVKTEIILNKCPSDYRKHELYIDIEGDFFYLNQCYIGDQSVETIRMERIKNCNDESNMVESKWAVEILISEVKKEKEVMRLLDNFCEILSLNYVKNYENFWDHGFYGFSFERSLVERRYAMEGGAFSDVDVNRYHVGVVNEQTRITLRKDVFEFPMARKMSSPTLLKLNKAFLRALRSQDIETRYVLLYYLFEIIYNEKAYQKLKKEYEQATPKKGDEKRSEILCRYLKNIGITNYISVEKEMPLDAKILCKIIRARNDLVHRTDTSEIPELMYCHLIPILQQVLRTGKL